MNRDYTGPVLEKQLSLLLQKAPARANCPAVGGEKRANEKAKFDDKPAGEGSMFCFCSPELYPGHALEHSENTFHGNTPAIGEEL